MPVTLPSSYDPILREERIGLLNAGKGGDLLARILANANWFYGNYCPPLLSLSPFSAVTRPLVFHVPVTPSADGLDYTVRVCTYRAVAAGTVDVVFKTSTTDSNAGSFGAAALTLNVAHGAGVLSDPTGASSTGTLTLGSTVKYLRIEVDSSGGATNVNLRHVLIYPKRITSAGTGPLASGAILWDASVLTATGGPINTEMFNRVVKIVSSVRNDRRHCLLAWAEDLNGAGFRLTSGGGQRPQQELWRTPVRAPGATGETCTMRARLDTIGAGTNFKLSGGHDGNEIPNASWIAGDDTDRTATFTLGSDAPDLWAMVHFMGNNADTMGLDYCTYEYVPTDPTGDIVTGATPPALLEHLLAANLVVERAAARPYTVPGQVIYWTSAPWAYQHCVQITGPGSTRQRFRVLKSINPGTTTAHSDPLLWTASADAGVYAAAEGITIPSPWTAGADMYPLSTSVQPHYGFADGGLDAATGPSATINRLGVLTRNRYPYEEPMRTQYLHGFTGEIIVDPVDDW